MFLHSPSLDIYHEHQVPDEVLAQNANNENGINITITVNRRRFCPACGAKGYKHENIFGDDCPLRGPCVTCAGACKVLVPASTQDLVDDGHESKTRKGNKNATQTSFTRRNRGRDEEEDQDQGDDGNECDDENDGDQPEEMISMKCRNCKGTGKQLTKEDYCGICRGLETVEIKNNYEVYIPPQLLELDNKESSIIGEHFVFEGEGNQQRRIQSDEKLSGNLYIYLDKNQNLHRSISPQEKKNRVPELVMKGDKLFAARLYKPALVAYGSAIEFDHRCYDAYIGRATTYLKLNNFEKATADAELAADINDMCHKSFALLGNAYEGSGQLRQALQQYERAKFLAPDPTSSDEVLAMIENVKQRIEIEDEKRIPIQGKSPFENTTYAHHSHRQNQHLQPRPNQPGTISTYQNNNHNNQNQKSNNPQFTSTFQWAAHQSIGAFNNNHNHYHNNHQQNRNPLDLFLTYDVYADELRTGCVKQVSVVRGTLCTGCMGIGKISLGDDDDEKKNKNKNPQNQQVQEKDEDMLLTTFSQANNQDQGDDETGNLMLMMMTKPTTVQTSSSSKETSCPVCSGHGIISEAKKFPITIKPGTAVGYRFEFPNEGNQVKSATNNNNGQQQRGNLTIRLGLRPPPSVAAATTAHHYNNFSNRNTTTTTPAWGGNTYPQQPFQYQPPPKTFVGTGGRFGGGTGGKGGYYAQQDDEIDEEYLDDSTDEEEERQARKMDQKTQWLRDLAQKHGHQLAENVLFIVAVSNQITAATFVLMTKSDIDGLGLPMGPRLALNDILKKEKGE